MIKPFVYFISQNLVRKSTPNISMAKSLLEKAETRLKRISKEKIKEEESSIVFEDIYESLREASQSLMELKGYKPYSHEALISFLKENNLLPAEKVNIMDNYRILRNNSVYKAEKVSLDKCTEALDFAKSAMPIIKSKFGEMAGMEEKDSLWSKGYFAEAMSKGDMEKKMRTFHMKHDEEMNYSCKKCNKKISAHNKDWHDGMCDECFNKTHFKED